MREFYERFYPAVKTSRAHALFCERSFGRNLCQHGFADMDQLEALLNVTGLGPAHRALDLGCGNGLIAEYLSDRSGARIAGVDYIPEAIRQAQERTAANADRLAFQVGDINTLDFDVGVLDTILSIDTIYFSADYARTIQQLAGLLRPGGQMAFLYSHGPEPGMPVDQFDRETLAPDRTPLAEALKANGLPFRTWDWTAADYRLTQLRRQVLEELEPQFAAEGITFIYENRMGEVKGIGKAHELGLYRRYLTHVECAGRARPEN